MAITQVFINLPVADIEASKSFYEAVGASINPEFSDENSVQVVLSDSICLQLMTHEQFTSFSNAPIPSEGVPMLIALATESRDEVDRMADAAIAGGGSEPRPVQDMGWLYNRAFADLDGHFFEVVSLDAEAMAAAFAEEN